MYSVLCFDAKIDYTTRMSSPQIDIDALARLARLEIDAAEKQALARELPEILTFVEEVSTVAGTYTKKPGLHRNAFRDDTVTTETGSYTESLMAAAPKVEKATDGTRIKVVQVIKR